MYIYVHGRIAPYLLCRKEFIVQETGLPLIYCGQGFYFIFSRSLHSLNNFPVSLFRKSHFLYTVQLRTDYTVWSPIFELIQKTKKDWITWEISFWIILVQKKNWKYYWSRILDCRRLNTTRMNTISKLSFLKTNFYFSFP